MIDWNRIAELRDEVGPEDFKEVVELFLQEVDQEIESISSATHRDGLSEKLHFLKGSALSLGFNEFSTLCGTGEAALSLDPGAPFDIDLLHSIYKTSRDAFLTDLPTRFPS
ncbi:MAG: Hpt domain-containing protein [Roseobacter sp.]